MIHAVEERKEKACLFHEYTKLRDSSDENYRVTTMLNLTRSIFHCY